MCNLGKFAVGRELVLQQRLPSMIKRLDLTLSFDRSNRTFEHELEYLEDMEHELSTTQRPRDPNWISLWSQGMQTEPDFGIRIPELHHVICTLHDKL